MHEQEGFPDVSFPGQLRDDRCHNFSKCSRHLFILDISNTKIITDLIEHRAPERAFLSPQQHGS